MNYANPELLPLLAERFVLGVLSRRARRRFSRLIDEDPRVAEAVYVVEELLAPLAWNLPPVSPSQLLWPRIARQAGIGQQASPSGEGKPASRLAWPLLASVASLAFVVTSIGWYQSNIRPPEVVVETVVETVIQQVPVEPSIGLLADADGRPVWVAQIYTQLNRAVVSVSTEPESRVENDYELWILQDDGVPVSLGLLPQTGERDLLLDAQAVSALGRGSTLAVSLEPVGGSPEAVPTGPVLYTAPLF